MLVLTRAKNEKIIIQDKLRPTENIKIWVDMIGQHNFLLKCICAPTTFLRFEKTRELELLCCVYAEKIQEYITIEVSNNATLLQQIHEAQLKDSRLAQLNLAKDIESFQKNILISLQVAPKEIVFINYQISVKIFYKTRGQLKFGIDAPKNISIMREELHNQNFEKKETLECQPPF